MRISDWSSDVCSSDLWILKVDQVVLGSCQHGAKRAEEESCGKGAEPAQEGHSCISHLSCTSLCPIAVPLRRMLRGPLGAAWQARASATYTKAVAATRVADRKRTRLNSSHSCAYR